MSEKTPESPVIEVVSGSPTPEELAAVVTVLTAAASSGNGRAGARSDRAEGRGWNAYWRSVRREHRPGAGAWLGR
ncbi:hypothetical protein CGZ98_13975 [Enemella evansiae]|uniref:acyl-CoA carboxylase subunit epsilon n=1 Tax=Enemella evansiae TaxID=2016499 RepID=UPI000B965AF3|nr:acyl-CoA carboxylase subunit epsilon [Enemella evansiae]OYO08897.1 hypothetical protein CGZ98_13975 [Enemella evansiae]